MCGMCGVEWSRNAVQWGLVCHKVVRGERGISSVGRAFALHAKGHGFDFRILHLCPPKDHFASRGGVVGAARGHSLEHCT